MHIAEVSDECNWIQFGRDCSVKIENTRVSNYSDVDKGSDCRLDIEIKSDWLLICFTFVMKSPGSNL